MKKILCIVMIIGLLCNFASCQKNNNENESTGDMHSTQELTSVEQENLMILQALAMMNDFDIKNFVCLFKCVLNEKRNKSIRISDNIIGNCIGQYNLTENNIILLKIILN